MYIKKLAILNYKSCQGLSINLQKDNPTIFIGMNDAGKSAILKGMQLLFDTKPAFNLSSDTKLTKDISNTLHSDDDCKKLFIELGTPIFEGPIEGTVIIAQFGIDASEIDDNFKESATNQLKWAIDSISGDSIYLLKYFSAANPSGRYYVCAGENATEPGIYAKKQTELNALRKSSGLTDEEVKNENGKGPFAGIELIRALYKKLGYAPAWIEDPGFVKNDLPLFPVFRYIDWNASLEEIEALANDVMTKAIKDSKDKIVTEARSLGQTATREVNKQFEVLTRDLTQDLKTISAIRAHVTFSVTEKVSDLIINKTTADGDIRLDSQGEGVKRQIMFAFLKWASRQKSADHQFKNFIWCFDEPESHLYPSAQREMYSIIRDLAKENYQVLIGTHSTIFVDRMRLSEIYKVQLNDKYSEIVSCTDIDDIHDSLGVRNSDVLFFDKFIGVEGETEEVLIPYFYKLHTGRTMEEDSIKLIKLGGIGEYKKNKAILENVLSDFKKAESLVHYILDADTKEVGDNIHLVGTCDIEDALPNELWIKLVQEHCEVELLENDLETLRARLDPDVAQFKLHKLIAASVASAIGRSDYLPSKTKCGEIFKTYITDSDQIPPAISAIFDNILKPIVEKVLEVPMPV